MLGVCRKILICNSLIGNLINATLLENLCIYNNLLVHEYTGCPWITLKNQRVIVPKKTKVTTLSANHMTKMKWGKLHHPASSFSIVSHKECWSMLSRFCAKTTLGKPAAISGIIVATVKMKNFQEQCECVLNFSSLAKVSQRLLLQPKRMNQWPGHNVWTGTVSN